MIFNSVKLLDLERGWGGRFGILGILERTKTPSGSSPCVDFASTVLAPKRFPIQSVIFRYLLGSLFAVLRGAQA
jgi:hypothetical protein